MRPGHRGVVLPLALVLAAAGTLASAAPIGAAIASIHRASASNGRLELAGIPFSYPKLNASAWILLGLALTGAFVIAAALRAMLGQRAGYRRFRDGLQVVGRLREHPSVWVIDDPRPQAFCAGFLRPKVYVSQAALNLLGEAELHAVLAHENHHLRVRDPLRFASGRVLSQALFFLPALRALFRCYADVAELNADGAAVRMGPDGRAALASALLVFETSGAGISPSRVDSLLGRAHAWKRPWWLLGASLALLLGFSAVTWSASHAASAQATFNLPVFSSQPCLAMLTLVPLLGCITILVRRASVRPSGPSARGPSL